MLTLAFGSFLVAGCLLVVRRPDNRIGWIFTVIGLLTRTAILAERYTTDASVTHPGSLPSRWRPVTWLAVGVTAGWAVLGALNPSLDVSNGTVPNPIGVPGADPDAGLPSTILNGLVLFLPAAAIASLAVRFRRSQASLWLRQPRCEPSPPTAAARQRNSQA